MFQWFKHFLSFSMPTNELSNPNFLEAKKKAHTCQRNNWAIYDEYIHIGWLYINKIWNLFFFRLKWFFDAAKKLCEFREIELNNDFKWCPNSWTIFHVHVCVCVLILYRFLWKLGDRLVKLPHVFFLNSNDSWLMNRVKSIRIEKRKLYEPLSHCLIHFLPFEPPRESEGERKRER